VEVTLVDFVELRRLERRGQLRSQLVPGVDVATREIGVPMLSEALHQMNECFDLAGWTASGCFDGCFVPEEEFFWVGVFAILREDSWVEAWRPLELFEFCQKRSAKALLRLMLMRHYIFVFLFIRV
jgi:hypothetical protein